MCMYIHNICLHGCVYIYACVVEFCVKVKDRQTDRQAGRLVDKTYIQTEEKTD